jgi:hypothetical protein
MEDQSQICPLIVAVAPQLPPTIELHSTTLILATEANEVHGKIIVGNNEEDDRRIKERCFDCSRNLDYWVIIIPNSRWRRSLSPRDETPLYQFIVYFATLFWDNSLSEYSFLLSSVEWGNSERFLTTLDCRKTFEFLRAALGPHRFLNTAITFKKWLVLNDIF